MARGQNPGGLGGSVSDVLKGYIDRWERLQEEKEAIAADQKEVMSQAKSAGFDTKIIREIIRLRKLTAAERDEREALLDLYKAALGMLNGTPLGEAAIRRLGGSPVDQNAPPPAKAPTTKPQSPEVPINQEPDLEKPREPVQTVDDAKAMGKAAAEAKLPVTENPFPARDPRRAAWDEAWCAATGDTGMEIPDAWKRAGKPDKKDAAGDHK